MNLYTYKAKLQRVIDGDTVSLLVDMGFDTWHRGSFRILGVNCPEMNTPEGRAAKDFTEEWLAMAGPESLLIESHKPDKYGRWLATIWSEKQGIPLNVALVTAGHAKPYMV